METRGGAAYRLFLREVIFTRARVSLALLSLRKNRGLLVVYVMTWCFDGFFFKSPRLRRQTSKCTRRSKRRKQDGAHIGHIELVLPQVTDQNAKVWCYSNRIEKVFVSGLHICLEFPNPPRVHTRLCKHWKKVFYCFYKITFPRNNAKLFVMALIKREILTSHKVLYTKSCTRNQFLFCKKMLSKIRIFLA